MDELENMLVVWDVVCYTRDRGNESIRGVVISVGTAIISRNERV